MQAVSNFMRTLEKDRNSWHAVPIYGHSSAKGLAKITDQEFRTLFEMGINTIGQPLQTDKLTGQYTKALSHRITNSQITSTGNNFQTNLNSWKNTPL